MTIDPQSIQALFARAIEIADPTEREKFITEECGDDAKLYERVANLLIAFDGSKGFLDQATQAQVSPQLDTASRYQPGNMIAGRYKLLEAIGEGGMGTVWVAEQTQPVRRKVALKLVKPGMDSKQVLARFDAERQALALMDHPNIAKVFDGGMTDQGRPFFVMELVKGMPLTEYCDQMRLSVEERLRLFVPICQAVQHAHQKGIIHRDLKPSNVLICLYDGKPVPKVIDFGLAKAMHQPLTEQTVHTGFGLMIGTPLYMSPEQAEHNNLDVDTRSDVYSLGVMLYELLTGSTPLEKAQFKEAAFGELLRLIKEVDPPKPSTRISSSAQLPNIAAQRNLDPAQLSRCIRGDLDWIVMKALEKDRAGRYETANDVARDIERFLNDETVEACPPSTAYKLRKLYRKNRAAILTTASFAILLVLGAAGSAWQAIRAIQAERIALQAETNAKEEQKRAMENEQKAVEAQAAEPKSRASESEARSAEAEQRAQAELQRDEAQRLQIEAVTRSAELEKLTQEQRRSIYASEMNLVRLEAQNGNLPRMREILMNQLPIHGDEDLRGFEWHYWYRYLTQAKVLRRFENFRYGEPDSAGAILPGGEFVAITQGKETRVVDIASSRVEQTIPEQLQILVNRTCFSANGRSVFGIASSIEAFGRTPLALHGSRKSDGFSVYGPHQRKIDFAYPLGAFSHVSQFSISEDGRFVAVVGNDFGHQPNAAATRLLVWNIESQQIVMNKVEQREWNRVTLNRDGSRLAAYVAHSSRRHSDDQREVVAVFDVANGSELKTLRHHDEVDSLAWHPERELIFLTTLGFSGRNQKEFMTWDMQSDSAERLSNESIPNFVKMAIRPDGAEIAIASHGTSTIRLINTQNGQLVNTLHNEAANIESLNYSKDGRGLVALATSGELLRWELAPTDDLFGLRTASVKSDYGNLDWIASSGMQRIAFTDPAGGKIWIRERDGSQTVVKKLELGTKKNYLRFSDDDRILSIFVSKSNGSNSLSVYDTLKHSLLWERTVVGEPHGIGTLSCFSPDQSQLLVSLKSKLHRFELSSGDDKSGEEELAETDAKVVCRDLVPSADRRRLWKGFVTSDPVEKNIAFQIRDAMSEEIVSSMSVDSTEWQKFVGRMIPSPDGMTLAIAGIDSVRVWDLRLKEQSIEIDGLYIQDGSLHFSDDGHKLIAIERETAKRITTSSGSYQRVARVHIVDIPSQGAKRTISFSGDYADDVKLSPDGKRLLSLHGKNPYGALDTSAKGKLWDADSGREILTLPVADRNLYRWDMFFDPEYQSLVALVFNKADGTLSQGNSLAFDGTPIPAQQDKRLIAQYLVQHHLKKSPIPFEIASFIQENLKMDESVRELALEMVGQIVFDSDKIAKECLDMIQTPLLSTEKYERALAWARAIAAREPDSIRSRSLIGAALYRLGKTREALASVKSHGIDGDVESVDDFHFEVLRRSVEVLCQNKLEEKIVAHRSAIALADFVHDFHRVNTDSRLAWPNLSNEALGTQGNDFATAQRKQRPKPSKSKPIASATASDNAQFANLSFQKADTNLDGQISQKEMLPGVWERLKNFDTNLDEQLDLVEFKTGSLWTTMVDSIQSNTFSKALARADLNQDMHISADEAGKTLWKSLQTFDLDKSGEISSVEWDTYGRKIDLMKKINSLLPSLELEVQLHVIEHALSMYPSELSMLNARSWIYSTCVNEKLRNGPQAVLDATIVCEASNWKSASPIATLAAAYAESGDFSKAVEVQQKGIALSTKSDAMQDRLRLYEQGKPFRDDMEALRESLVLSKPTANSLMSSKEFVNSRRIRGGEPCWSPDSKQLLYSLSGIGASTSYFEILDLASGSTRILADGGEQPVWSSQPDGSIAVTRVGAGGSEVWLLNKMGQYERKIANGTNPRWTTKGQLYFESITNTASRQLMCCDPNNPSEEKRVFQGTFSNLAVSRDGTRLAFSKSGQWSFWPMDTPSAEATGFVHYLDMGSSDWSYDGKYIVFGASSPSSPGIWLIEANTGKRRLLIADVLAAPRWSPDGKTIAAGLHTSNEIVLLDLSSLDLAKAFASE